MQEMQQLGSLRQKDSKITESRPLDIYIFNVQYSDKKFKSHFESLEFVKSLGFHTNPYIKKVENIDDAILRVKEIGEKREDFTFGIDRSCYKGE